MHIGYYENGEVGGYMTMSLGILLYDDIVLMSLISRSLSSSNKTNNNMTTGFSIEYSDFLFQSGSTHH